MRSTGPIGRHWPISLGVIITLPFLLAALWLTPWIRRPPPLLLGQPPRIIEAGPFLVRAGRTVEACITVVRPYQCEPLLVRVEDLPDGVTCEPAEVDGFGPVEVTLRLAASLDLDAPQTGDVTLKLFVGSQDEAAIEQKVPLTVRPFRRPTIREVSPSPLHLIPGRPLHFRVRVEANGNADPWALRVDDLPAGVELQPMKRQHEGEVAALLSCPADASDAVGKIVRLVLLADGLEADSRLVSLSVERPKRAPRVVLRLRAEEEIRLQAGAQKKVEVRLTRQDYDGPVTLQWRDLPAGVTGSAVTVAAERDGAALELRAEADAGGRLDLHEVRLVAMVDDSPAGERDVRIRLTRTGAKKKKKNEADDPKMAVAPPALPEVLLWPRPVKASIPTGDGLTLNGTFYPPPEAPGGACVLMLSDLLARPSLKQEEGWAALARSLQKRGCAVLALDFRGFGENREVVVSAEFWTSSGFNRALGQKLGGKAMTRLPRGLDGAQLLAKLPAYLPWLAQDVVAARHWLDARHEQKDVNTQNLFVLAAGEGAQVATIWLAAEHRRYKLPAVPTAFESRDVAGCVWLGYANSARIALPAAVTKTINSPPGQDPAVAPMAFVYDKKSPAGTAAANHGARIFAKALGGDAGGLRAIEAAGVTGMSLVLEEEKTEKVVMDFFDKVTKERGARRWAERGLRRSTYAWQGGAAGKGGIAAKAAYSAAGPGVAPLSEWGYREPAP